MVYFCIMLSKTEQTRQHIIVQSADLFNTKGYAGTSMADILEATRMAKGGIYGHFAGKDDIAVAAFEYGYHRLIDAIRSKTVLEVTARGKLIAILAFYKNYTIDPVIKGGCMLLNTAIDADDNIPFLKEKAASALTEMLAALQRIISLGIENSEFKATLPAKETASYFFALIEGGIMMAKLLDDPTILNRQLDRLADDVNNW